MRKPFTDGLLILQGKWHKERVEAAYHACAGQLSNEQVMELGLGCAGIFPQQDNAISYTPALSLTADIWFTIEGLHAN